MKNKNIDLMTKINNLELDCWFLFIVAVIELLAKLKKKS